MKTLRKIFLFFLKWLVISSRLKKMTAVQHLSLNNSFMNLKGQWNKLNKFQQGNLIFFARRKLWRNYWGLKKKYLIANEKGEN